MKQAPSGLAAALETLRKQFAGARDNVLDIELRVREGGGEACDAELLHVTANGCLPVVVRYARVGGEWMEIERGSGVRS